MRSPFSEWFKPDENSLMSLYDSTGTVIRTFGKVKKFENTAFTLFGNNYFSAIDKKKRIYIAVKGQNRIEKYSPDGELLFTADRPLNNEITFEMVTRTVEAGSETRSIDYARVTSASRGIGIDHKSRIWVLTFLKFPENDRYEEDDNMTDFMEFDVFDNEGILLFKAPYPNRRFDTISMYGDRLYIIDLNYEMCVFEYKIVDYN